MDLWFLLLGSLVEEICWIMDGQSVIQAYPSNVFFDIDKQFSQALPNLREPRDSDLLLKKRTALQAPTVSVGISFIVSVK